MKKLKNKLWFPSILIFLLVNVLVQAQETPPANEVEITSLTTENAAEIYKGNLRFQAKQLDRNLDIGDYRLRWQINPKTYQVNTSLVPRGLVSLLVSFQLREESTGTNKNGLLTWQKYEIQQVDDDKNKPYAFESAERIGKMVKFGDKKLPFVARLADIPSAFIILMQAMANPEVASDWSELLELVTSRDKISVIMKRLADEKIEVPAGTFTTRVVQGEEKKNILQLWFDINTKYPVKIVFSNSKGERFLLELVSFQN